MQVPPEGAPPANPTLAPSTSPQRGDIKRIQSATQNPWSVTHLQVAPGFHIYRAIDAAAEEGIGVPKTNDVRHLCLSCHFKGVCNSNCGVRHSHRTMTKGEMGIMTDWINHFCAEESPPLVTVVETGHYGVGTSVAGSAASQSRCS